MFVRACVCVVCVRVRVEVEGSGAGRAGSGDSVNTLCSTCMHITCGVHTPRPGIDTCETCSAQVEQINLSGMVFVLGVDRKEEGLVC